MPTIFLDDGGPDATDFDSNYLYYDEDDIESVSAAIQLLSEAPDSTGQAGAVLSALQHRHAKLLAAQAPCFAPFRAAS